jgi:hypothetical protein
VTCYVPQERRKGGKEPAQRRSFKGVLLGYADNMPAYRIWDLGAKSIKSVSYNFTICHEGYYPFRERTNWPTESVEDLAVFHLSSVVFSLPSNGGNFYSTMKMLRKCYVRLLTLLWTDLNRLLCLLPLLWM